MKRFFSVELENYRQYKGKSKIEFSVDAKKNFTIVEGPNGAGKTNLVNAITWCLYGKELRLSKVSTSLGPINGTALKDLRNGNTLDMAVRIRLGGEKPEYKIERWLRAFKDSSGQIVNTSTFRVMYLAEGRDWKEHLQPTTLINNLLPEAISGFFLFDGERLDDFFKTENREGVKQALVDVSQINLVNSALDRLEYVKNDIRRGAKGFNSQADSISGQIETYNNSLAQALQKLKELETKKSDTLRDINEINEQLEGIHIRDVQKLLKERNNLNSELENLENEKSQNEQKLMDLIVGDGPLIMTGGAIKFTLDEIEKKYRAGELPPSIREQYIKDLLKSGKCICGSDISQPGPHRDNVEKHLKNALFSQVDEKISEGKYALRNLLERTETFSESADKLGRIMRKRLEDITIKQERLTEISTILSKLNSEEVQRLESDRQRLNQEKDELIEKIGSCKADIERYKSVVTGLDTAYKRELRKSAEYAVVSAQIELCQKAMNILEQIKEDLLEEIRKTIEIKAKEYFRSLIWKKDTFVDVKIDGNYSVSVIHKGGWDALGTLSAGEREVLALSFMAALQTVSGFDFPVIIDTPLGRISGEPKENTAQLLPNFLSETQVTMLVTDQEYTDSVRSKLMERIGKEWRLLYDEKNDETRVESYAN